MSAIKRWFEDHVHEFSDKELRDMGYSNSDIKEFRECYPGPKEDGVC